MPSYPMFDAHKAEAAQGNKKRKRCQSKCTRKDFFEGTAQSMDYLKNGSQILRALLVNVNNAFVKNPKAKKGMEEAIKVLESIEDTSDTAKKAAQVAADIRIPDSVPDVNNDGKRDWYDLVLVYSTEGLKASDEILEAILELLEKFAENDIDVGAGPDAERDS